MFLSSIVFKSIYLYFRLLQTNWEKMDQLASKEPIQKKRAARYKVDQVKQEMNGISAAVNHIQARLTSKWRVAAEREELLTQRFGLLKTITFNGFIIFVEFDQQKLI